MENDAVFWLRDPNVLLSGEMIPVERMRYNEMLNALSRLVIVISLLFYFFFRAPRALIIMAFSLFSIVAIQAVHTHEEKEAFISSNAPPEKHVLYSDKFSLPTSDNPFQNFSRIDALDRPDRKPAGPAYNPAVAKEIQAKLIQGISDLHPTDPNYMAVMLETPADRHNFEQSLRPFYTLPNTTGIPDIDAFSKFVYGESHEKRRY